jgi:glycosyltransferase involved in cell wall biosynthesis
MTGASVGRAGRVRVATIITRLEGGAGAQVLRGVSALDRDAFETVVITGSGSDRLLGQAATAGLPVILEPSLRAAIDPRSDVRALRRLGTLLRQGDFGVVHTHCAKAGALGRLAAHRSGVPRIVHTYHGFPFHEFQPAPRRGMYVAIERRLGRLTDVTLCVGTGVAVEAIRRGLAAPERIRVIGVVVDGAGAAGPMDAAAMQQARRRARHALGIPAEAIVVGSVGRLTYQKAPEHLLAALAGLGRPDVIGVWVGGGELADRMASMVRSTPSVRLVLAGDRGDVPDLLPAFDVFALPSRYEGLPTALVEAMVSGVPVVATAVNAVADVVIPGETGLLVPPARPRLLAEAVRYLIDSPAAAARMATAARARLGSRFTEAALRDALLAAYAGAAPMALRSGRTRPGLAAGQTATGCPAGSNGPV